MEQRLVAIELKLVGLEDTIQSLNETVYEQQKQLDEMRALCRLLLRRMDESDGGPEGFRAPAHERPPHY